IADIVNVIGNAICIYYLHMGVVDVAISTLLSRILAGIIIISILTREKYILHINKSLKPHFEWNLLKRVLNIGIPYGVENGLFQIGRLLVLSLVSTLGTAAIAANSIGYSLVTFTILPGFAINLCMTVVISRCIGAQDYNQARYYTKKILAIVYVSHILINALIVLLLPNLLGLYNISEYTFNLTYNLIIWHIIFAIIIWPIAFTLPGTFRGAGDAKYPMYISISVMFICRIFLAYVFVWMGMGVFSTWLAMFIDWFVRAGLYVYRYFNDKWTLFNAIET
ncbi:MAG: MATE family efflux transporter, partial [Methanobacteriaceae archaeon]|nr:MATE family efflux transporter [Methanobacteriaceae archaeon]